MTLSFYLSLSMSLTFCKSGNVSSSHFSNVSKVTVLLDFSLMACFNMVRSSNSVTGSTIKLSGPS